MVKYKMILSNGFRDHNIEMSLENRLMGPDSLTVIFDSFAKEIIGCDSTVVRSEDIIYALENDRTWFKFDGWLVDIYAVGV